MDDIVTLPPVIENGDVLLPTGPGWGADVNEEFVLISDDHSAAVGISDQGNRQLRSAKIAARNAVNDGDAFRAPRSNPAGPQAPATAI